MNDNNSDKKGLNKALLGEGRVSVRFRNINIALFALTFILMIIAMLFAFNKIIMQVSSDYAGRYAASSAEVFSAQISREISLMAKAAHSKAVIDWLTDEDNDEKMMLAYVELSEIIGELYSNNLYVGIDKSLNEYKIDADFTADSIRSFVALNENNPDDAWYFTCIASDNEYELSVDIDHVLGKKRVWLDYKIVQDGVPLGVICTGLDFSHIAGELFAQYKNNNIRGLIINEKGVIYIDSSLLDNKEFLNYDFQAQIEDEFSDPVFLDAVKRHLDGIDGNFDMINEPVGVRLPPGPYRYATIAPVRLTNWSSVILYDSSSLLGISLFLPISVVLLILLIAVALATNTISYRYIFNPLEHLIKSLERLQENHKENIYGVERNDEFGDLASTIQDLFTKANYDALTGIHNRRFLENNLQQIMEFLSRSNGSLSMLMVDVDYFKRYNDTYGHEQGDVCLKMVAQTMAGNINRLNDFAARYGGEEFVAVLPNTDEDGARIIAEKLLESVRMLGMPHADSDAAECVTVSIGVTSGKVLYTQSWEDYLKRADEAMYTSKQSGRNRYTYLDFIANGQ